MEIWWMVNKKYSDMFAGLIREAHAEAWEMFFLALGFLGGAPVEVKQNVVVNIDHCVRKEVNEFVPEHIDYGALPNGWVLEPGREI